MAKNKNGGGRGREPGPGPIDPKLADALRYARRRAERGAFPAVTEKSDEEFGAKVQQSGKGPESFEDKLAAKRAALGLAPVNLDDIAAKQQAEMKAKAERKRPVKPENILPADPEVSIIPEVPTFQKVLEDLENKERIPVAENFANQLIEEFALNDELAELLRHHLDKMGDLATEQKKAFHSILECFKKYVEKDFLPEDWQKRTILSFMLIFVKDHGYKFNDSEINLVTMLRINDLSLDEELNRRHADRQRLEEQARERDADRLEKLLTESNEPEKSSVKIEEPETPSVELPVDLLPLSSPEDILEKAGDGDEELTPEVVFKDILSDESEHKLPDHYMVGGVLEIPPVEMPSEKESKIEEAEFVEKESPSGTEKLSEIAPKLAREYQHYAEQVENLEVEIATLEDRNRAINAWSEKQNPDWHNQDDKLKEYGDLCREYTLNIQKLRDLDIKISRAKVLFTGAQAKAGALLNAQALGLPLTELATRYENEAEDIKADLKSVKVVLANGKITEAKIVATEGKSFGGLRVEDKDLDGAMSDYVQAQRHFIKGGVKEISPEDNKEIDKVLRLDYLSQYVDYSSLLDESGETEFAKHLDQKYFEIQQRIANRYKILLPTRKANIPLYFEGNQARIPVDYLRQLYLYNRQNSPELKKKLDEAQLPEAIALVWTEAVLLGQVMRDSTITLAQLSGIKYRLNAILTTHEKLKNTWIPIKDKEAAAKIYPYLKVEKGWYQLLPEAEIKEKMTGENLSGGIFEYQEKYFDKNFAIEHVGGESYGLQQLEKQEAVKRAFMDKLKAEIFDIKGISEEEKQNWLDVLDYQIYEMIKFVDTPDMESITELLTVRRDQYILTGKESADEKQTKVSWYQFYDGLVKLADKIS
ncbi:MAG TPA: hypothetical protein PLB38_02030 [bacterium]|nr:hypothetical protein [bacterium]